MAVQNSKSLRILYWNARSIAKRKSELSDLLSNIDIFLCVESWIRDPEEETERNRKKKKGCFYSGSWLCAAPKISFGPKRRRYPDYG